VCVAEERLIAFDRALVVRFGKRPQWTSFLGVEAG
jgi:hypothetical protein